jgi:cell division protein FtsL
MSRPAAARRADTHKVAGGRLRAVPPPRRVSGPTHPSRTAKPVAAASGGLLLGAAGLARTLPDSRALDRLIRGRTWVAVIAVALIGIVAMQVHMLGLNAGIGRAVEKTSSLAQQNTALRMEVSRLSSSERIAAEAQRLGLVMPNAGEVRYLRSHETDGSRAARVMRSPDPDLAAKAEAAVQAGLGTGASALAPDSQQTAPGEVPQAPATTDPAAAQQQATTAPPAQQAQQPQQATTTTPQQPVTQTQTQTQAAAPTAQTQQQQPAPVQQAQAPTTSVTPAGGAAPTAGG